MKARYIISCFIVSFLLVATIYFINSNTNRLNEDIFLVEKTMFKENGVEVIDSAIKLSKEDYDIIFGNDKKGIFKIRNTRVSSELIALYLFQTLLESEQIQFISDAQGKKVLIEYDDGSISQSFVER